jgi:O-antigen/teichoic acid export membrane protein
VARAQLYIAAFFAAVGLVGILMTPPVIRHFIDPRYAQGVLPAQILLAAGILHGWHFLALGSLLVRKQTSVIACVTVAAAVLNVLLNFMLIPRYASRGAATATLAAEIMLCAGMWAFAWRTRRKPPRGDAADYVAAKA